MRRAIIALVSATALMLTGLTPGPLRVSALGETSVTLNCTDSTSLTLLVDADTLASLTAAVQGMIDYPAGLSCTLVQNPLTTFFGHVVFAATNKSFVVAGGRWLVECTALFKKSPAPMLTVVKHVINDSFNGGSAVASDFTMTVSGSAVPVTGTISFPGSETGTTLTLQPGGYTVTETGPSGYVESDSSDCTGSLSGGDNKTCTVTNNDTEGTYIAPTQVVASTAGSRSASLLTRTSSCDTTACVWVNIAVNLHYRDGTNILEGTLNETIPEHQSCPNPDDPTTSIAVGPSHFDSKPTPSQNQSLNGCLSVIANAATTRTFVTQISGLPFPPGVPQLPGTFTGLQTNDPVNFSFLDNGNPSQWTDSSRDMLEGPPVSNIPNCPTGAIPPPSNRLENGNINVHPG